MNTSEIPSVGNMPVYIKIPGELNLREVKDWKITPVLDDKYLGGPCEDDDSERSRKALVLVTERNYNDD